MVSMGKKPRPGIAQEKARGALSRFAQSRSLPHAEIPVRIESVAEWLGFQVVLLYTVDEEFSGLVSVPQRLIGVNGKHHRHRRRFTLGHELAHILLQHPPESRCSPKEVAMYNAEADACAAELLMPTPTLMERLRTTRNIGTLAEIFDVSEEAMRVKLKTMNTPP